MHDAPFQCVLLFVICNQTTMKYKTITYFEFPVCTYSKQIYKQTRKKSNIQLHFWRYLKLKFSTNSMPLNPPCVHPSPPPPPPPPPPTPSSTLKGAQLLLYFIVCDVTCKKPMSEAFVATRLTQTVHTYIMLDFTVSIYSVNRQIQTKQDDAQTKNSTFCACCLN